MRTDRARRGFYAAGWLISAGVMAVTGAERRHPPEVDQAAYRIVQEALTNVSRHAGHACASVHLHYTPETLSIQVGDDGKATVTSTGTRPSGPGLGLIGMRERVT